MTKIAPTSRLPYTGTQPSGDKDVSIQTINAALSTDPPAVVAITGDLLGCITSAASYYDHFKSTTNPHTSSIRSAWKNRKTP